MRVGRAQGPGPVHGISARVPVSGRKERGRRFFSGGAGNRTPGQAVAGR